MKTERDGFRIAVIGAGVNGLACGIRLRERGWPATIFAERRTPETTSDRAAAVFSPFRIDGHPWAERWTRRAFEVFGELARREPASGVSMRRLTELFFRRQEAEPWWASIVQGFQRVLPCPPPYADGVSAIVPHMDMTRYMPWLERRFVDLGGTIITRHMNELEELFDEGFAAVANCAGIGAGKLARDATVTPMRGQILHVTNTLRLTDSIVEEGRGAITTYVFPFEDHVVLGGTFERGEGREETQEAALAAIVERCQAMLRAMGQSGVERLAERRIRVMAGLRPGRVIGGSDEAVRLEREEIGAGRWVIHNYGHGRAGVTLSWGCAEDVAELIEQTAIK